MASIALQRPVGDDHVIGCKTQASVLLSHSSASRSAVCNKNGTHILGVTKGKREEHGHHYSGCWNVAFLKRHVVKLRGQCIKASPCLVTMYAHRMCVHMCQHCGCEHTHEEEEYMQKSHPLSVLFFYLSFISYWKIVDSVVLVSGVQQ